ncbi:MAG: monofunctional biosynthetic peptidoglycan transglycosylase [Chitinophagaceae bacterium]|nr:monofunctional biosynthetic peptidoglycan transglycosylase [Chitinophagaceae bacterium]
MAGILKEVFYIVYISSTLYVLLGILFNPLITITQVVSLVKGNGLQRDYISYQEMGPNIKLAVIASEDQLFPDHDGFDLKAIKLAMKYNKRHPNKIRGASTISQQVAKNVFLFQGGGFFRKGLEVFFTFTIEGVWTKRTILERYLNIAETGRGVFGVQAAARKYFNKDAKDLTRGEAAQIAACLPNPKKYTVKPLSAYVAGRYDDIMRQMNNLEGDPDVQEIIR